MNVLGKYYSSAFDAAKHRVMKIFALGPYTADLIAPFGDDSCPPQGADVIYMTTENDDQPVIVGIINTGLLASEGEKRLFSYRRDDITGNMTNNISFYTWYRTDGTYELGGTEDNAVRFNALNISLQKEIALLNAELTKIQIAISSLGGSYVKENVTLDISSAKINEIKTL